MGRRSALGVVVVLVAGASGCSALSAPEVAAADAALAPAASGTAPARGASGDGEGEGGDVASNEPAAPEPVAGPFNEARVQEIVRAHFDGMGQCYAKALPRAPKLAGTINVSLTIDGDGAVVAANAPRAEAAPSTPQRPKSRWAPKPKPTEELLTDAEVVSCVESEFKALRFPPTGRGLVTLVYPVVFRTE